MTRLRLPLVVLSIVLTALTAAAEERQVLLRHSFAGDANDKVKERDPKPKRSRYIEPDFHALQAPGLARHERKKIKKHLSVALFDDVVLHVELEDVERNGIDADVWSGRIEGDPQSSVVISVKDNALNAMISTLSQRWAIEPTATGAHEAFELDLGAFPPESQPLVPQGPSGNSIVADAVAVPDSAATIDVLVVYTDDLRVALGGTAGAQTAASNAIAATNTAYANSGVTPRVRLVGTMEVTYAETGNLSTTLSQLRNAGDTHIDEVHTRRNEVGADAVAMLTASSTDGSCGVGYVMTTPGPTFAPNAFNVTHWSCAVGNLSFPHELGHNFGLAHDRLNAGGQASYNYSYGYQDTQGGFRDIMAYANGCPGACPRIPYFSTPEITYLSRPLGVNYLLTNAADNVRALNNNAQYIANFRQAVVATPVTFTDDPLAAAGTRIKAIHLTELQTAVNAVRTRAGLTATTFTAVAAGGRINAAHITALRTALTPALTALGRTATFTDASLTGVRIKAAHIQELREYCK